MLALFNIVQGTIGTIMTAAGFTSAQQTTLPVSYTHLCDVYGGTGAFSETGKGIAPIPLPA